MLGYASIGVEVPDRQRIAADAFVLLLYHGQPLLCCPPRPGRLLPHRHLGPELRKLLNAYHEQVKATCRNLQYTNRPMADALLAQARSWVQRIQQQHLTTHHLRLQPSESFQAFALPDCARLQLLRQQAAGPSDPEASALQVCIAVRATSSLRQQEPVAVYLRAPYTCPRTGRRRLCASGQWQPLPDERAQAQVVGQWFVVVVW